MKVTWTSFLLFFLVVFVVLSINPKLINAESEKKVIKAQLRSFFLDSNGDKKLSSQFLVDWDGTKYLPVRETFEKLGNNVLWDKKTRSIIVNNIDNTREMIDFKEFYLDIDKHKGHSLTFSTKVGASGAIVIEDQTDQIMFEKNGNKKHYPASTVKIMTGLLALEYGDLKEEVIVSDTIEQLPYDSRLAYIEPGDILTLEQLLYGMLVYSGNDCAVAIAEHISGSVDKFVSLMNKKAKALGAYHTNFVNPHGYHDPAQYTTPYDLAKFMKAALKKEKFKEIISTPYYKAVFKDDNGNKKVRYWKTTNRFLRNDHLYKTGVIGGKTGYTDASKYNLVTVAEHNQHQYITVVLKGDPRGRYIDTKRLLTKAYQVREDYNHKYLVKMNISYDAVNFIVDGKRIDMVSDELFTFKGNAYLSVNVIKAILTKQENKTLTLSSIKNSNEQFKVFDIKERSDYISYMNIYEKLLYQQPKKYSILALSSYSNRFATYHRFSPTVIARR